MTAQTYSVRDFFDATFLRTDYYAWPAPEPPDVASLSADEVCAAVRAGVGDALNLVSIGLARARPDFERRSLALAEALRLGRQWLERWQAQLSAALERDLRAAQQRQLAEAIAHRAGDEAGIAYEPVELDRIEAMAQAIAEHVAEAAAEVLGHADDDHGCACGGEDGEPCECELDRLAGQLCAGAASEAECQALVADYLAEHSRLVRASAPRSRGPGGQRTIRR
jgi:hypothetical protein